MISSTVSDLLGEREAIKRVFERTRFVNLIGADPVNVSSFSGSPRLITDNMAHECDLYILILGNKFGLELPNGKSATEIEFDAAFRDDPTKILVFKKEATDHPDIRQERFIEKACNYYTGYWRTTFKYTHELQELVLNSFTIWLKDRASLGKGLNYSDHFIRVAKQIKPESTDDVFYKVTEDDVELEYIFFGTSHTIQFKKKEIYNNFWGCINKLQEQILRWLQ